MNTVVSAGCGATFPIVLKELQILGYHLTTDLLLASGGGKLVLHK